MASTPLPGGSRHVGRVIDPSVREDGEPEPALELEAEKRSSPESGAAEPDAQQRPELPRGERVRELLLERAELTRRSNQDAFSDLDEIGLTGAGAELDPETPLPRPPGAPSLRTGHGHLSPTWVAVFGTLLGLATVASLVALAMNVDVRLPAPAASASVAPPARPTVTEEPKRVVKKRERQKIPGPFRVADARSDPNLRLLEGKVGTDAFLKALEKAGVPLRETYRILTSMKGVREFDRCKASERFSVLLERGSNRVEAFEYVVGPEEVYQSREGSDGLLKGQKLDLKVERNQVSGALVYDGKSFEASALESGFDPGLSKVVTKALDGHLGMDELERGARVRVITQEITVLGDFGRYAGVEALEVQSADPVKKPLRVYYLDTPGERGYYDGEGRVPYEGGWRKPISDAPVTSPFNLKRLHPILKTIKPHLGIDFGAPTGTPVGAASYGTVSLASYVGPTGNLVKIQHANAIETGYAHLSRFAEGLKVGDKVKRLQVIGYVGSTGRSTGPHLHFSARRNGEFFDPATLRLDAMRTVSKDNRAAFSELKSKYDALLEAISLPEPLRAPPEPPAASAQAAAPPASAAAARAAPLEALEGEDEEPGQAPAPAPSAASPGKEPRGSAVHLTDKELLELQGATDEGEVSE